jgi:hypothetical protein
LVQSLPLAKGLTAIFFLPTAALNLAETALNMAYLYLAHVSAPSYSSAAPLVGFAAAVATLAKTILYGAVEWFCGGCSVGHNDFGTLFVYWIIPNG